MSVKAFLSEKPFDISGLTAGFNESETHATGTIVMHHGKVKRPGKQIPDFKDVLLEAIVDDPEKLLLAIGEKALEEHGLNQALIVHRVGVIGAGDDVLFAAVSASTRVKAFAGCAAIVDAIKEEHAIRLVER